MIQDNITVLLLARKQDSPSEHCNEESGFHLDPFWQVETEYGATASLATQGFKTLSLLNLFLLTKLEATSF